MMTTAGWNCDCSMISWNCFDWLAVQFDAMTLNWNIDEFKFKKIDDFDAANFIEAESPATIVRMAWK